MLGTVLGDEIPHVESAVPQPVTEHVRAGLVGLSRRIKGRDPHQIGRKTTISSVAASTSAKTRSTNCVVIP